MARDDAHERRKHPRLATTISVAYGVEENFLFSYMTNISEMGIFIQTPEPHSVGTPLQVRFDSDDGQAFDLEGVVTWINPYREHGENLNPGMGIHFNSLTPSDRERIVEFVRTVAYLKSEAPKALD